MTSPAGVVDSFTGGHHWLSNFHLAPFVLDGITYPSGEHAFQAAKTLNPEAVREIVAAPTPGAAKGLGRKVPLRPDWEQIKRTVMGDVVAAKFSDDHPALKRNLIGTGDALLIEGNTHHDSIWGQCVCPKHGPWAGRNWLGQALMSHRATLTAEPADRFTRVAVTGHRPQHIPSHTHSWVQEELARIAIKLRDQHGTKVGISGEAVGADQWWSDTVIANGLDLWAYIPFEVQPDRWHPADRARWAQHRAAATREIVLSDTYDVRLLHARNEHMIRDANALICVHDPAKTTGGTATAMSKATAAGKTLIKVDITNRTATISTPRNP